MKLRIKVKPGSREAGVEDKGEFYLVKLKSMAKNNEANLELLKFLKRHFKKEVKIRSGFTSRNKIIELG